MLDVFDPGVTTQVFWFLVLLSCAYAFVYGGRDGILATFLLLAGTILTGVAVFVRRDWGATNLPVMAVDVTLFGGLIFLALRSRSFWPTWMAAAQLLAVLTHVASIFADRFDQKIYAGLESVWAIPCLGSMVVGIALDRRGWRSA